MKKTINRREFLKLAGLLPLSYITPHYQMRPSTQRDPNLPNVLVIVFDAWSAANTSLYGYERKTTPLLEKLAKKAIVYHNHISPGNFTTPGTASLLTGTLPWTHRAVILNDTVDKSLSRQNIFHAFNKHYRMAYTHNPIADTLLRQFMTGIDEYTPLETHYLKSNVVIDKLFQEDRDVAALGWNRAFNRLEEGYSYSLFISDIFENHQRNIEKELRVLQHSFPRGIPNYENLSYFTLEQGIDGLLGLMDVVNQPIMGYYHFLPPHDPYKTRVDFIDVFADDGYQHPEKPKHLFDENMSERKLAKRRRLYDEFIRYVDSEFARLYAEMANKGLLDNTWLVLTSDHGELFERGIFGHLTPALYQPVVHTPLVIFPPGQSTRVDVHQQTSSIDLLPTLLQVTGQDIPDWVEGQVLPPFLTSSPNSGRDIYALKVNGFDKGRKFSQASATILQDQYKLIWYFGFEELGETGEMIELYDLSQDPDEVHNLYPARADIADQLLPRLRSKF